MATAPQSDKSQRPARTVRRHPRRPVGFGLWVLVALACVPTVGAFLYAGGVLACVVAAIFVVGIYVHYVRLSQRRAPLSDTIYSGGCLLPVLAGICAVVAILAGSAPREPVLAVLCMLGILVAIAGALAGYLTATLIEAGRLAWACTWVLRRKRRRRTRKTDVPWGEERDTELISTCFWRGAAVPSCCGTGPAGS